MKQPYNVPWVPSEAAAAVWGAYALQNYSFPAFRAACGAEKGGWRQCL
ncbi:MAG: hypothetical protein IJS89_02330 [Bacteroidaceae bacterium]|nr:hypothetical protein [Bacteroidaceae bacterium]